MKTVTVHLESVSPYSQSKHYDDAKLDKELPKDYEIRTWRERMSVTEDGRVFIPPMAFKNCLAEAAKYLSLKIPGKRNATYTKHFLSGILVTDGLMLPDRKDEVPGEWLFVPSDGKTGGGSRVSKCFPLIRRWEGDVVYYVMDETITKEPFAEVLQAAGRFIGIGRFRPARGGYYGRFEARSIVWV
jgi:hypothetical protein